MEAKIKIAANKTESQRKVLSLVDKMKLKKMTSSASINLENV
jgi:hypothetical protein